jgi:hypothetical protein
VLYFSFLPQRVIRITVSTCLEEIKKMPVEPSTPLVLVYIPFSKSNLFMSDLFLCLPFNDTFISSKVDYANIKTSLLNIILNILFSVNPSLMLDLQQFNKIDGLFG